MRRRDILQWTLPPSGMMKCRATRNFGWLHSRKVELIGDLWLCFGMFFSVCRLYCKADGIASCAIFANVNWCKLEYMKLVETLAIIVSRSLYANLGFRHYVSPLYSIVSLMKV